MSTTRGDLRRQAELLEHLTRREFRLRYRGAVLGWLWAVGPPLARLAVLSLVFTAVLPVGEDDYVALLAVGLLAWTFFASGVSSATRSAADRRELLSQPGLPREVMPAVSVLTDGMDYLATLPVLLVIVVVDTGRLPVTALLLLPLLLLQTVLVLGVGMACSVADVRLRDTRLAVDLVLGVGFYLTPVFYTVSAVPDDVRAALVLNPLAALIEAQRDVLVRGVVPGAGTWLGLLALAAGAAALGWRLHRRYSGDFLDAL